MPQLISNEFGSELETVTEGKKQRVLCPHEYIIIGYEINIYRTAKHAIVCTN